MIGLPGQHWLGCLNKKFDTAKKSSSGSTNKVLPESRAPKPVKVRVLYLRLGVCASERYLGVGQVTQWLYFHTINIKHISKAISMNPCSPVKEESFCNQKSQGVNPPLQESMDFFPSLGLLEVIDPFSSQWHWDPWPLSTWWNPPASDTWHRPQISQDSW